MRDACASALMILIMYPTSFNVRVIFFGQNRRTKARLAVVTIVRRADQQTVSYSTVYINAWLVVRHSASRRRPIQAYF